MLRIVNTTIIRNNKQLKSNERIVKEGRRTTPFQVYRCLNKKASSDNKKTQEDIKNLSDDIMKEIRKQQI